MAGNLKREIHFFTIAECEKEERFLREKHKNGLKFVNARIPCFYTFERCEPEDVVYKLDFNPVDKDEKERYIRMYSDYGWEYMQDLNEFSYFRKPDNGADETDMEIFSDDSSKLQMAERIFKKKFIPLFAVFLLCLMPQLSRLVFTDPDNGGDFVFTVIFAVLFLIYIIIFVQFGIFYYNLKKKLSDKK